jgi:AraC-like DNA-binding protein
MKSFVHFGDELYLDCSNAHPYGTPDMTMAHMHSCYELLMVLDPIPYSSVIDGKIFHGKGPMIIVVAPYCMHFTYYTDKNIQGKKYIAFFIGENYLDSFKNDLVPFRSILGDQKACIFDMTGHEEELKGVAKHITDELAKSNYPFKRGKTVQASVTQKLYFGVLVNMIKEFEKGTVVETVAAGKNYISDVIMYIVHNLNTHLTTPDIAERFFVSRDKLNRDFKKYVQMSIRNFIMESRMNLAKSLLVENKMNICEIATSCGFENEKYFYSFFKKNTGLTPKEYSKKIRQ